ncbi:hypothetical protein AB0K23_36230 [Streptomyces sp. NPDC049602]|uniref:hypothetical protein n=1 Tax=Streptomyces sp. NPDC049602 TaxID=3155504 RepID=UPI0034235B0D
MTLGLTWGSMSSGAQEALRLLRAQRQHAGAADRTKPGRAGPGRIGVRTKICRATATGSNVGR